MDLKTIFTAVFSTLAAASIVTPLLLLLLKAEIEHRLTIDRARQQEERQFAQKQREASVAVTEILGLWIRSNYMGPLTNEDRWKLQTTYWKNIMLLDRELLSLLLPALAHQAGSVDTNEILVQARRVLLGLTKPDITADALNNWPPDHTVA